MPRWRKMSWVGLMATGMLAAWAAAATALPSKSISGHASGDYAIAQASGTINHPGTLKVVVTTSPAQKVDVTWDIVCNEAGGGVGSKTGQFTARAPLTRTMKKPASHVTSCIVSGLAQLSGSGKVKITLKG